MDYEKEVRKHTIKTNQENQNEKTNMTQKVDTTNFITESTNHHPTARPTPSQTPTKLPHTADAILSPSLPKLVQNLDEELQREIDNFEDVSPTTSHALGLIVKEKLLSFLPNIQDILLTNITKDMEEQSDKYIQKLQDKANDIAKSSLNIQQEQDSYKQATEKIKNRIFFIDKQMEESTKRLEKYENNMNQKYKQLVHKQCNDVMEFVAEKLTDAEEEIYATVESLKYSQAIAMTEITETMDRLRQKLPKQSENDDNHQEALANLQTYLTMLTRRIEDVNYTALADINTKISSISDEMQRQQEFMAEILHREAQHHKYPTSKTNT